MVSDLFHSGGHKSFAFISARLRILLPPAFAGFYQIKKIKNIIEKDYDKFKDAWKNHKED
ncbi:MAG: hypothetical protein EVJ48_07700 [Candidatus Acidulodesulfobacterium acidiphilum]|uniref:Uncharacterized protein n=1 Tax=Candidatus Acidulodesulfobacterium acidiphilum TaxID=2597224 RepID=A0A520XA53_9DELT|nr:MAG: hypothetical protein EVJ48_07700 [Candidatus Acidulodesulfobacterium acidiphilum]